MSTETNSGEQTESRLGQCPACGWTETEDMRLHDHLYKQHTPSDFGLTPMIEPTMKQSTVDEYTGDE